ACKLFQYTQAEMIGRPIDLLIPARFVASHREQVAAFARSPASARMMGGRREVLGRRKDGTEFPAEISISKFTTAGKMTFTDVVRDVSLRKQYEIAERALEQVRAAKELALAENAATQSKAQYERIVETANEGIWELDADARVEFINDRMAEMLGYGSD